MIVLLYKIKNKNIFSLWPTGIHTFTYTIPGKPQTIKWMNEIIKWKPHPVLFYHFPDFE